MLTRRDLLPPHFDGSRNTFRKEPDLFDEADDSLADKLE